MPDLARISHTNGTVIAMKGVDPSPKGPNSVAVATVEALSAPGKPMGGGRFMATLRAPDGRDGPIGVRNPG